MKTKKNSKKSKFKVKNGFFLLVAVILLVFLVGHFINSVNADTEDMFSGGTLITSGTKTFTRGNENQVLSDDCTAYFTDSSLTKVNNTAVSGGKYSVTVTSGTPKTSITALYENGIQIKNTKYDLYMEISKIEYTMTKGSSDSATVTITSGTGGPEIQVDGMDNNNSKQGIVRADCKFYAKNSSGSKVQFKGLIRIQNIGARKGARILGSSLGNIYIESDASQDFKERIQYIKGSSDYFIFDPLTHDDSANYSNHGAFTSNDKANVYVEMTGKVSDLQTKFYFRQDSSLRIGPVNMVNNNKGFKSALSDTAQEDYSSVSTENMGKWSASGGKSLNSVSGISLTDGKYYTSSESYESWITSKTPTAVGLYNYKNTTAKTPTSERWTVGFNSSDIKKNAERIKSDEFLSYDQEVTANGNHHSGYNAFIENPNSRTAGIYARYEADEGKYYYYYSFPLTANKTLNNVATVKYSNAATVNGQNVDIYMDINNLKVTNNPYLDRQYSSGYALFNQVIFFNCFIGYSDSATFNANNITYVRPSFGVSCFNHTYKDGIERAKWLEIPAFADVSYRFAPSGTTNFINVKGCLKLTDIDHGQGVEIRDFTLNETNNFNVYYAKNGADISHIRYKSYSDGSGTYFYDTCTATQNNNCDSTVYVLAGTESSVSGVPTLRNSSNIYW